MITSIYVAGAHDNYAGTTELDTLLYPLQRFSWEYVTSGYAARKPYGAGRWKTRRDVEYMTIQVGGEILASSTSEYWTRRKALMTDIIPPPTNEDYDHVKFLLTVDGDATQYYAMCILDQNLGALESDGSPTVSAFELSFECREGYWKSVSGDVVTIL